MDRVRTSLSRPGLRALAYHRFAGGSGLLLGAALGTVAVLLAESAVAYRAAGSSEPVLDVTHLPPLLTEPGEPVELRYDVYCASAGDLEADVPCDAAGTVFVRPGVAGPFRELPVRIDPDAVEGRHVAIVPADINRPGRGFGYFAAFRSEAAGLTLTLPAAGAQAPQQTVPLEQAVKVRLGEHAFGAVRRADARVVETAWGDGSDEIGLEQGRNVAPVGGSSFDVDSDGTVYVLDQVHRRILRWKFGGTRSVPVSIPLSIDGTLADLAVAGDRAIYVLEMAAAERTLQLRIYGPEGEAKGVAEIAERTASQVRIGSRGPIVLQHPSGQWMPVAIDGRPLGTSAQKAAGRPGRGVPGGGEVVVLRSGNEIRAAIVDETGVRQAWHVTSRTPVAEVQLAEPLRAHLVLVVRVYTDDQDEFVALLLGPSGLVRSFSVDSADWAETAPLSRFRIGGSALYQLGSTPAGPFVDRFDLEVK